MCCSRGRAIDLVRASITTIRSRRFRESGIRYRQGKGRVRLVSIRRRCELIGSSIRGRETLQVFQSSAPALQLTANGNEDAFFSLLFSSIDLRGFGWSEILPFDIERLNNEGRTFLSLSFSVSAPGSS